MNAKRWVKWFAIALLGLASAAYLAFLLLPRNGGRATLCPQLELPEQRRAKPAPNGGIAELALGGDRSCAVTKNGNIWCWGASDVAASPTRLRALLRAEGGLMQVGTDSEPTGPLLTKSGRAPALAPTISGLAKLAQHRFAYCTLDRSALLRCSSIVANDAARPPVYQSGVTLANVQRVLVGNEHACSIKMDGTLWCWGRNDAGQLGLAHRAPVSEPTLVREHVSELTLGLAHTCALLEQPRRLECWGDNGAGQLGKSNSLVATEISTLAAGASRTCALTRDGSVWCWGQYSITFPVRVAGTEPSPPESRVPGLPPGIEQLAGGGDAFCARTQSGKLSCWGYLGIAHGYQYPDASAVPPPSPAHEFSTPAPVRQVSMGDHHLCALLQGDRVVCLGSDGQRQLGAIMQRQETRTGACGEQPFEELTSSTFVAVAW